MIAHNIQLTDILLIPIFLLQNNGFRVQPSAIKYDLPNTNLVFKLVFFDWK